MKKLLFIVFAILLIACEKEWPANKLYIRSSIDNVFIVNGIEYICKAYEYTEVKKETLLKIYSTKECQGEVKLDNGNTFSTTFKVGEKYLILIDEDKFRLLNNEF